jgi:hypothetical protein
MVLLMDICEYEDISSITFADKLRTKKDVERHMDIFESLEDPRDCTFAEGCRIEAVIN